MSEDFEDIRRGAEELQRAVQASLERDAVLLAQSERMLRETWAFLREFNQLSQRQLDKRRPDGG